MGTCNIIASCCLSHSILYVPTLFFHCLNISLQWSAACTAGFTLVMSIIWAFPEFIHTTFSQLHNGRKLTLFSSIFQAWIKIKATSMWLPKICLWFAVLWNIPVEIHEVLEDIPLPPTWFHFSYHIIWNRNTVVYKTNSRCVDSILYHIVIHIGRSYFTHNYSLPSQRKSNLQFASRETKFYLVMRPEAVPKSERRQVLWQWGYGGIEPVPDATGPCPRSRYTQTLA